MVRVQILPNIFLFHGTLYIILFYIFSAVTFPAPIIPISLDHRLFIVTSQMMEPAMPSGHPIFQRAVLANCPRVNPSAQSLHRFFVQMSKI